MMSLDRPAIFEPTVVNLAPPTHRAASIGVGVIGLGRAGCWHLERFGLGGDFSLITAWDDCLDAAGRAAGLVPKIAGNRRAILDDSRIDLVVIATPPATHAALAMEALAAGKHVLLETPCAMTSFEAQAVLETERRSGRSVIVAHQRRWDSDFRMARDCLASGEIGDPLRIKFVHWQYSVGSRSPESSSSYGKNEYPASAVAAVDWRDGIATGGGTLWEAGIHRLDQLLLLANDMPAKVYARMDFGPSRAADTGFLALIHFASGVEAQLEVNRGVAAPLETGWVIAASRGSYAAATRFTVTDEGEIVDVPLSMHPAPDDFHAAVASHLRREGPNPVPLAEACRTIQVIEAIRESSRTGRPVMLNN